MNKFVCTGFLGCAVCIWSVSSPKLRALLSAIFFSGAIHACRVLMEAVDKGFNYSLPHSHTLELGVLLACGRRNLDRVESPLPCLWHWMQTWGY